MHEDGRNGRKNVQLSQRNLFLFLAGVGESFNLHPRQEEIVFYSIAYITGISKTCHFIREIG